MTRPRPRATPAPPEPLAIGHPAAIAALVVAAACIASLVSFQLFDPDLWQHLRVGRAIWETHTLPRTNVWTWPTYGEPYVLPSWLFRVMVWPFYQIGGVFGLFVWRWLTTLAAFSLLWAVARRMGARGMTTLVALVWCAMLYRQRSQVRPETLAAVLMAAQLWLLETRRSGGRDRTPAILAIAWVWANAHISYTLGLALTAFYLIDEWWSARHRRRRFSSRLPWVLGGSIAVSFLHPFGWRALAEPFEFALGGRKEIIYRAIGELQPIDWSQHVRDGLPAWLVLVSILAIWRWRRAGFDRVQALVLVTFLPQAFTSQRFLGFLALAAAPFFARDLDAWVRAHAWPAWTRPAGARAALASATCVAGIALLGTGGPGSLAIRVNLYRFPVKACDYLEANGIRGHGFNEFWHGGYLLWRFWPDRGRLPFMDIHQTGTRVDRDLVAVAPQDPQAWYQLDRRHAFDWVLVADDRAPGDHLLDTLDADTTWALVSLDDSAALYLRRHGRFAALADRDGYRWLSGGKAGLGVLGRRAEADSSVRTAVRTELERAVRSSPWNANAHSLLANVAMVDGQWQKARSELDQALAVGGDVGRVHERLATISLAENRPKDALAELQRARRETPRSVSVALGIAAAEQALGRLDRARTAYQRALAIDPGFAPARDSLAAIESRER